MLLGAKKAFIMAVPDSIFEGPVYQAVLGPSVHSRKRRRFVIRTLCHTDVERIEDTLCQVDHDHEKAVKELAKQNIDERELDLYYYLYLK